MWAICRACSGSERAVSVNGVFFRVVCVQCAINVYRKAVRTVRERGAAGEGVGARARTTDRLPSPLYIYIYKVNYISASLAIIYVHCFMLCYALLCMHLYHLIYVILFNLSLIRFYAFHMCGLYEPLIMHSYLSDNLCNQMHSYACTCGRLPYARLCISVRMHCDEWLMHVYARLCVMQLNVNLSSCVVMLP